MPTARARATAGLELDPREPALEIGVGGQRLVLARQHCGGTIQPAPGRDVDDGVVVADDVVAAGHVVVQDLVVALGLATIPVDRVGHFLGCRALEMDGLAGERPEARGDEEEPGEELGPVGGRADEAAGLLAEIKKDGVRVEDAGLAAAGPLGVDDRRQLAVGVDGEEGGSVLLALARVDGHHLVGKARLLEEKGHLGGVGRGVEVEADHEGLR